MGKPVINRFSLCQIVYLQQFDQTIPQLELQQFENGEVWFNVTSTSNPSGLLSGKLPRLTRNQCTGMTKYVCLSL